MKKNCYTIQVMDQQVDIEHTSFKDLYICQMGKINIDKIWEGKWNTILRYYTLDIDGEEWGRIWNSVHDNMVPYKIQTAIWEMIHLNFYCGYKEKLLNYGEGKCKLCGQEEEGPQHIVVSCRVLEDCINNFSPLLRECNEIRVGKDELAFGLAGANITHNLGVKDKLRNLLTFTIRTVVFRNRHIDFGNEINAKTALINKINFKIKQIINEKYIVYKHKFSVQAFKEKYLVDNIIGSIENGILCFSI